MMRHLYIRFILGLVWLAAAIVCAVQGSLAMTALYIILGLVFLYSAWTIWKKDKEDRGK